MLETLHFETPLGAMIALGSAEALHGVYFAGQRHLPDWSAWPPHTGSPLLHRVRLQLEEYLEGCRNTFDLPLAQRGTPLQQQVWNQLSQIPYGQTLTYSGLARAIGRPQAVRAVAQAVGRNPWLIVRPCHRVIGSDGSLRGFAAGLERKSALLTLEARGLAKSQPSVPAPLGGAALSADSGSRATAA